MAKTPRLNEQITSESDFTPGGFLGTVPPTTMTVDFAKYSRVKDKIAVRIRWRVGSSSFNYSSYTGNIIVSSIIPSGLTLHPSVTGYARNGFGRVYSYFNNSSATNQSGYCNGTIERIDSPVIGFRFLTTQRPNATTAYSDETISWSSFGNNSGDPSQFIQIEVMLPILEWA
jgi:hypothetical protein